MTDKILQKADSCFMNRDYKSAWHFYSNVLTQIPEDEDAQIGLLLTDMAMHDDEDKAQNLFNYYTIIKSQDEGEAYDAITGAMGSNDDDHQEEISSIDGITYQEFEEIITAAPQDKIQDTLNNILFSTKLIITKKQDFMRLILLLMRYNFDHMIINYLETFISTFENKGGFVDLSNSLSKLLAKD